MPATLKELVTACVNSYAQAPLLFTDDVAVTITRSEDDSTDIIAFRGSKTTEDWMRDFTAVPVYDSEIGFVHAGFLQGMDDILTILISGLKGKPLAITGHSLGGARARIAAAKLLIRKVEVTQLAVFGSPKPAFINTARIIQKSGIQHSSYRNRNDVVPVTPFTVEPLFDYVHTEDYIQVDCSPEVTNLEPLRDHSISLYAKAITELGV